MMDLNQKIKDIAGANLANPAHFIVGVFISKHQPTTISVIVDGDKGITIDDCAILSHKLSEELETMDLIKDAYRLEVSTPGLDHPLRLKRQYYANLGRSIKVHLANKTMLVGKLVEADEDKITLTIEEGKKKELKNLEILFTDIEKTIVIASFK